MSYTTDLFAPAESRSLLGVLDGAFTAWRTAAVASDRLRRDSSLQVYEDMWNAFSAWCVAQPEPVTLEALDAQALELFLSSREERMGDELSDRHAWRLLTLIDRVLTRYALDHGLAKNSAAAEYIRRSDNLRRANTGDRPPLDYLDAEDGRRLVIYLSGVRPGAVNQRQLSGWQELRNLTAVALHLGAGLTPGDVRGLPVDAPVIAGGRWKGVPWKLKVPGNGNRPARETPVAPWAGRLLKHWLVARANAGLPVKGYGAGQKIGPFLLPSRTGEQWGKMAHYEAVQKVMQAAGVDPGSSSGGAFRLRHTFAIRQLRREKDLAEVARWMGIANSDEMERYSVLLDGYQEAV